MHFAQSTAVPQYSLTMRLYTFNVVYGFWSNVFSTDHLNKNQMCQQLNHVQFCNFLTQILILTQFDMSNMSLKRYILSVWCWIKVNFLCITFWSFKYYKRFHLLAVDEWKTFWSFSKKTLIPQYDTITVLLQVFSSIDKHAYWTSICVKSWIPSEWDKKWSDPHIQYKPSGNTWNNTQIYTLNINCWSGPSVSCWSTHNNSNPSRF